MAVRPRPEVCVGAVVVDAGSLLLVRRGRGAAVGQWSVPGGRVESGETLAQAVVREVAEETGLTIACGRFLGWVERISDEYHYVIHDFLCSVVAPIPPPGVDESSLPTPLRAGDDADDAAWVPLDDLSAVDLVEGLYQFLVDHAVVDQSG